MLALGLASLLLLFLKMLFQLVLTVGIEEFKLDIFFKRQETGEIWLKHHYLVLQEVVWKLRKTRDFEISLRRIT